MESPGQNAEGTGLQSLRELASCLLSHPWAPRGHRVGTAVPPAHSLHTSEQRCARESLHVSPREAACSCPLGSPTERSCRPKGAHPF